LACCCSPGRRRCYGPEARRVSDWLLFLAFAAAGIWAVRNVLMIALIAPIVIVSYIPWKPTVPVLAAVLVLWVAGPQIARGNVFQFRAAEWRYPAGAADFLLAHNVSDRCSIPTDTAAT
jgi:hypothetical protein